MPTKWEYTKDYLNTKIYLQGLVLQFQFQIRISGEYILELFKSVHQIIQVFHQIVESVFRQDRPVHVRADISSTSSCIPRPSRQVLRSCWPIKVRRLTFRGTRFHSPGVIQTTSPAAGEYLQLIERGKPNQFSSLHL